MDMMDRPSRDALDQAEQAMRDVRAKVVYAAIGPILILWGLIYATCFSITHFAREAGVWAWLIGNTCGMVGTLALGWVRSSRGPALSASGKQFGRRLGLLWVAVFIYIPIWLTLLTPWQSEQMSAFITTAVMFVYVVMGLWLRTPLLAALGGVVTALTFGGYFLFYPGRMDIWLAFAAGGVMLISGAYLTWRRR